MADHGWVRGTRRDDPDYAALHAWSTRIGGFLSAVASSSRPVTQPRPRSWVRQMPGADGSRSHTELRRTRTHRRARPRWATTSDRVRREEGRSVSSSRGAARRRRPRRARTVRTGSGGGPRGGAGPELHRDVVVSRRGQFGRDLVVVPPTSGPAPSTTGSTQLERPSCGRDGYVYGGRSYAIRKTVETLRGQHRRYGPPSGALPHRGCGVGHAAVAEFMANRGSWPSSRCVDQPCGCFTRAPPGAKASCTARRECAEHPKALGRNGPRAGERLLWFTTTGWMMWNLLIGGMLVGPRRRVEAISAPDLVRSCGSPTKPGHLLGSRRRRNSCLKSG